MTDELKPQPFMEKNTIILFLLVIAVAVSCVAIYDTQLNNSKITQLETQLNNTDRVINVMLTSHNAVTAFDQDVVSYANNTNNQIRALEIAQATHKP